MRRRRRWVAACVALFLLAAGVSYLRADKRQVFREVAGQYASARELDRVGVDGQTARLLELVNHRGERVASVWVRRPQRLAGAYRILVVYAGQATGERILELLPSREDLVLAAIQYPYAKPRSLGEKLAWPGAVRRAAFRSVAGGLLAVSYLEREEGLDPRRLAVVGASLGSVFAVIHAALDPRVPQLVVLHGGGDLPLIIRTLEARRGHAWRGRFYAAAASILAASFEPLRYVADVAPRETILVGAREDTTFPPASTLALYRRAGEPKRLVWTGGAHVRARADETLAALLAELERVLGPPAPAG